MNKELNKLGKKVVALHECTKKGMTKKGYAMFKEAMQSLMTLEANGCKSEVLEKAKAILTEYYNTYKTQIKKDTTRVIVEAKSAETLAKEAEAEKKKKLKGWHTEIKHNLEYFNDSMKDDFEEKRAAFHAQQIKLAAEHILQLLGGEEVAM